MQVSLKRRSTNFGEWNMLKTTLKSFGLLVLLSMLYAHLAFATSTSEVWKHHLQAWEARSIEAIVSDYSDESVLILNNEIFRGPEQIGQVFTQLFKIFDAGVNRIKTPVLYDRFVYITWHFTPRGKEEIFGTDTFVIEEGKIILQTIASPLYEQFPVLPLNK